MFSEQTATETTQSDTVQDTPATDAISRLFLRDGTPATHIQYDEKNHPFQMVRSACGRCGGEGGRKEWEHTGYTCYACSGTKFGPAVKSRLYTAAKIEKLNISLDKRRANDAIQRQKAAEAAQARQAVFEAQRIAEAALRRDAFLNQHGDAYSWLESNVKLDEDGHLGDGFFESMLDAANRYWQWTDAQQTAVYAAIEKRKLSQQSRFVGETGDRLTLTVTVERTFSIERPRFGAPWLTEVLTISTLRDQNNNCFVVKSTSFRSSVGFRLVIVATVKEHSVYNDIEQTVLTRVKVKTQNKPAA